MRNKSKPGKPRLFQILPKPSVMALGSLSPQLSSPTTHLEQSNGNNEANEDNSYAHCSMVPETCEDGGQITCQRQTPNAIDDMTVEEERRGKSPAAAMCSTQLETYSNGGQKTTCQKQTPNVIDDMAVEEERYDKSPDAICTTRLKTFNNGGQNTSPEKQAPNIIDDMVVDEEFCVKAPENIHTPKACSEIWSEKEVCIKCDEGGKLFVCSDSYCPLAVHAECMRCSAHFDSKGKFYCPFCSYKQVVLETRKARKKAMLAKKALSVFLDRQKMDGVPLNEKVDEEKGGKKNLPEIEEVNNCCGRVEENCPKERPGCEFGTSVVPCDVSTSSDVIEQNNVIGKCMDTGKSVHGIEETENRIVTEQASESVREKTPKTIDDFQNKTVVRNDQEVAVPGENRKSRIEPDKPMEGSLADGETEEENPKIVDDFRNKRVKRRDQKAYVMGGETKLGVAPEKSMEGSLDKAETEEEDNSKAVDGFQNKKRVERHDQETSSIGTNPKLGVEPEESIEESLDEETEEENPKICNDSQNTRVERHDQEASVIGNDPKLRVEPEESMEDSVDDTETDKEMNPKVNNNSQNKRVEQHDQEASVIGKTPKLSGELVKSMEGKLENAGIEKEVIQNQQQESSGPASGEEDSIEEHDDVASDSSEGVSEVVLRSSRRIRKKIQNVNSANGEGSRQKSRDLSFKEDGNKAKKKKSITSISRQPNTNTGFPNLKRKRMPWTAEEEEMLKEGVGRFSSTANKNLPWKKILDFGRHVFHGSRTPDNLKDKWRNQMR